MDEDTSAVSRSDQKPSKEDASARWRKLIEQQRESGLAVSAYCRQRGLSAASMFAWRRRLRSASGFPVAEMFKPVKIIASAVRSSGGQADCTIELPTASTVELCLRGERRLIVRRGFDRQLLLDVIDALEPRPAALEARS
jgi:hypothetical protein